MAKFDIKTVKPKFVVTTSPENKIDVVVSKPIIEAKNSKSFFKLKNTGGPRGLKGEKGDPGQDSTIEVVSTTTGAAGTDASVVNQGTASAAQLAFTIPRGDKGETGASGAPGQAATIAVESTSTLPAGSSATVTNVGTSSAARLAFGIPKGDTGATGQDGDAATITVGQVETLAPNQPAYVNNVGTSSQAIFNIGIPKGDKGDSGSGTGDMLASTYDPNGTVAAAGGIPDYVDSNGGKIDTIKVNGTAQTITNKTVDISVPTKTSDLTNDGSDGTSTYVEADELATVATSGLYSDLTGKPTIPTVNDATLIIKQNGTTVGTFTANASSDKIVTLTDTTYSDFLGATGSTPGSAGLVPAPTTVDVDKVLKGDGTWGTVAAGAFIGYVSGDLTMMIGTYFSVNTDTTYNVSIDYVAFKNALTTGSKVIFRDSAGNDMVVTGYASAADTYYVIIGANRSTGLLSYDVSLGWTYYNVAVPQNFSQLSGAISTSQITSKAVTSAKIDWSTVQDEIAAQQIAVRSVGILEPVLTSAIGDSGTATYTINNPMPDTFIYINTHINIREVVMLTYLAGFGLREDVIIRSVTSGYSTFSLNGNVLTITGAGNCRGMLYLLRQATKPS